MPRLETFSLFRVAILLCWCFIPSLAHAQTPVPPPPNQTPVATITVSTREVLLDLLVTDRSGQPVTGLTSKDFTVTEEGATQAILSLQEHRPLAADQVDKLVSTPPLPPNTFTNYVPVRNTNASTVILIDALDSPIGAQMYLREQVIDYLKHMEPGAQIAIFQLDTEMRLIQGFSSDQKTLLEAAKSKRDMPSLLKPINGDYGQYRRARMQILRAGMQMMGRYLSGYPGRKNLIWFTGQVPMTIFGTGMGNPFRDSLDVSPTGDDFSDLTESLRLSRVAVYPVDSRGLENISPMVDARNSNPRAAMHNMHAVNRHFENNANLDLVAEMTGGKAFHDTNGLAKTIGEVIHNGSNYYTVAYATTNQEWHGQFRKIKIEVNRPDLHLQYRNGYHAYDPGKMEARKIDALMRETAAREATAAEEKDQPETEEVSASAAGSSPQRGTGSGNDHATPSDVPPGGDNGTLIHHAAKSGFELAMALGAIAPTEIVLKAEVEVSKPSEKLAKGAALPENTYLKPEFQHKPFRTYEISIHADARNIHLSPNTDGRRHGSIDYVAVVYQPTGEQVNSILETITFDLTPAQYRSLLAQGLNHKLQIAVPEKGNFFLRVGVHDLTGDQVGALELAMDQIKEKPSTGGL